MAVVFAEWLEVVELVGLDFFTVVMMGEVIIYELALQRRG